ncbi:hypothetical protein BU24DRAFT_422819 [Aaosphaeria arxii CBS 175.79]|uniref:PARP catalytic domain-containing protein n=1 Tax=Aaosphaeria arxii CBS 175.79 TaxID=1450172 RepID=A0A6A5XT19_9PLEO|nr:uncharacterized protein BU24DRAFT_422819 [Aaosphaeria arxii CBS 175.79]KAF2016475.1 hypothetical protein BU24DRAFT_422819 [Aaosphaeria arxii CBS 175.79]
MNGLFLSTTLDRTGVHVKRISVGASKKSIFGGKKDSEEWHQQIEFTAGFLHPSDQRFPCELLRKHTDQYLKRKGKLTQQEVDIRLSSLIDSHEARDVAVAACAYAMSPTSVRALLNVNLSVTPTTFFGLEAHLQSLIAANGCNPGSVSDQEASWARQLLPFVSHGLGAAGKFLEGVCTILDNNTIYNMDHLPDFAILTRSAFESFALHLEGLRLKSQWTTARSVTAWFGKYAINVPSTSRDKTLRSTNLLDSQFPSWRVWSSWEPNLDRVCMLDSINIMKRAVLPDIMALDGPDFIIGNNKTLKEGLIAQYGATKSIVRFRGLVFEVTNCKREELKEILDRLDEVLTGVLQSSDESFEAFFRLLNARPIIVESLQLFKAVENLINASGSCIHDAVLTLWTSKNDIGGFHIDDLSDLIVAFEHPASADLCKLMIRTWLVQGIETCIRECRTALRTHIDNRLEWHHLADELHSFFLVLKSSTKCYFLLDVWLRKHLELLPSPEDFKMIMEICAGNDGRKITTTPTEKDALEEAVAALCTDRLIGGPPIGDASQRIIDAILDVWKGTKEIERRRLALVICKKAGLDYILKCRCLAQITLLPGDLVKPLSESTDTSLTGKGESCVKLVRLLAQCTDRDIVQCWRGVLFEQICESADKLADYLLQRFDASAWTLHMLDIYALLGDCMISSPKSANSAVLRLDTRLWVQSVSGFIPVITRLEEYVGSNRVPIHCILNGGEIQKKELLLQELGAGVPLERDCILRILKALRNAQDHPNEKMMQFVASKLIKKKEVTLGVAEALEALLTITQEGADACQRIIDLHQNKAVYRLVTEVVLAGWVQDDDMCDNDITALTAMARVLGLEVLTGKIPDAHLIAASDYFAPITKAIVDEADRLADVKLALKSRDPVGTALLLGTLNIEDTTPLDDELALLPITMASAVEKRGDKEIEISFPLSSLTEMQRTALGLRDSKNLLLRLFIDWAGEVPTGFCLHLDDEFDTADADMEHLSPWVPAHEAEAPELVYCRGRNSALTWQLNRILHQYIKQNDLKIASLHTFLSGELLKLAYKCVVCGSSHGANNTQMRRAMPCQTPSCSTMWNRLPLDIRIPELRSDVFAVDMLLTAVYVAAKANNMELLPGCPITNPQFVINVLEALPPLSILRDAVHLSLILREYHYNAEVLLTWACSHFRGFIASARGNCKIPGLPVGTHQFVLANAAPHLEVGFASTMTAFKSSTRVLFHGTSLDRLPAILAQGLRIKSGTALQRTGAAHGKGVYLAEEPSTSAVYSPSALSWRNSGLSNMRLLIGCEVSGPGNSKGNGIHVIKDEKSILVRYIFLLPKSSSTPVSQHLVPAMSSTMAGLRSGAI